MSGDSHGRKSEVKALTEITLDRLGLRTSNVVQVAEDVRELQRMQGSMSASKPHSTRRPGVKRKPHLLTSPHRGPDLQHLLSLTLVQRRVWIPPTERLPQPRLQSPSHQSSVVPF